MPTFKSYSLFIYVNLAFLAIYCMVFYLGSVQEIKDNWNLYRCNPAYWLLSDNISKDFTYCVQNSQMNMMQYLLQPYDYMISALTSSGSNISESINDTRQVISNVRGFTSDLIGNIFSVFANMIIEFQKITISIKDMVGKMVAIVVTLMYMMDGSIKTMNSAWNGPAGQMVRGLSSCFDPQTIIQTKDGKHYKMEDLPLGIELMDGGKVFSVMKLANMDNSKYFRIKSKGVDGSDILVTGNHYVFDKVNQKWVKVKKYKEATCDEQKNIEYLVCLITTSGRIQIGEMLFWDWEDDALNSMHNFLSLN
jgi:hypothetical protein